MNQNKLLFSFCLTFSIVFFGSCFHKNLLCENELQFAIESNELVRLKLTDGKLIEGFIVNEGNNFLVFYNRAHKKLHIKKEDVKSCELLYTSNYYSSISHWLSPGDRVLVLLKNGKKKEGNLRVVKYDGLVLVINKITTSDIRWDKISQINLITKASGKISIKSIILTVLVFGIFYFVIRVLTSPIVLPP